MTTDLFPLQYDRIAALLAPYDAYLVGGAVRDLLLDLPIHDLDFALPSDTLAAGKLLADQLGGAVFTLDERRATVRVILGGGGDPRLVVDLTLFQGDTIEEDLAARDFTITSMALRSGVDHPVIDPFNGAQDLREGLIRSTSDRALADDPLRCLRAVRLAAQLDFQILPDTIDLIRKYHHQLADVSPERIRDELFRILEGPRQAAALLAMQALGMYGYVLPGQLADRHSLRLRNLEAIWSLLLEPHDQDRAGDWFRGLLVHRLGRYREQVRGLLDAEPVPGRSIRQLSLLLPLIEDFSMETPADSIRQVLSALSLSNQEITLLEGALQSAENFLDLTDTGNPPQPLDIYRYYRGQGESGLLGVFLGLARYFGTQGLEREAWINQLECARALLEGFWDRYEQWVDPPVLVDGSRILKEFSLQPGPKIGYLLEKLKEEQVHRELETVESALDFLKSEITQLNGPPS